MHVVGVLLSARPMLADDLNDHLEEGLAVVAADPREMLEMRDAVGMTAGQHPLQPPNCFLPAKSLG
jgi:hypothetical protein